MTKSKQKAKKIPYKIIGGIALVGILLLFLTGQLPFTINDIQTTINPAQEHCSTLGYKVMGTHCIFPTGSCPLDDFYSGLCGTAYNHCELYGGGETHGLLCSVVGNVTGTINRIDYMQGKYNTCGDHICGNFEDKFNCPIDCGTLTKYSQWTSPDCEKRLTYLPYSMDYNSKEECEQPNWVMVNNICIAPAKGEKIPMATITYLSEKDCLNAVKKAPTMPQNATIPESVTILPVDETHTVEEMIVVKVWQVSDSKCIPLTLSIKEATDSPIVYYANEENCQKTLTEVIETPSQITIWEQIWAFFGRIFKR